MKLEARSEFLYLIKFLTPSHYYWPELGTLTGSTPLRQVLCFTHFIDLTGSADPGETMEFLPRLSGTNPSIDFPGEKPKEVPIDKIDGFFYLKIGSLI